MAMDYDLLAGTRAQRPAVLHAQRARILVFDSGLGGLSVLRELRRAVPQADYVYVADDAGFPYGDWPETALSDRIAALFARLIALYHPDLAVVACNTASTLVLPRLRAAHAMPFVGTVPAIKPAVAGSASGVIAVLATPGTVKRDYTQQLIDSFAHQVRVELVGSRRLAQLSEQIFCGEDVMDTEVCEEILPCFVSMGDGRRTDVVVLACTHYPLIMERLAAAAPWPVRWIDPAPAISRRVASFLPATGEATVRAAAVMARFTGGGAGKPLFRRALARSGIDDIGEVGCDFPCAD
jgi:glutamate racemase